MNASKTIDLHSIDFYLPHNLEIQGEFDTSKLTSVYIAELSAIYSSLRRVQKLGSHSNSSILLISESKVAIQNISKPLFKRKTPPIIIFIGNVLQYHLHFQNCNTDFIWIPAHADRTTLAFHFPLWLVNSPQRPTLQNLNQALPQSHQSTLCLLPYSTHATHWVMVY